MIEKKPILLWVVISLVGLSCFLDIGTFLYFISHNNLDFEINPIFIFLKAHISTTLCLIAVISYKLLVNGAIIWLLLYYKPEKSHIFAFLLIISVLIAVLLQCFGAYQNISVHQKISTSEPGTVNPLTTSQSYYLFSNVYFWYLIFVGFEVLSFWIYEALYKI